jgi:hypothetical protein
LHSPVPSQVDSPYSIPDEQLDAPQTVPSSYNAHSRSLVQRPVRPQLAGACSLQSSSGSVSRRTPEQTPSAAPVSSELQASQGPSQIASQHTPSAHSPDWQSFGLVQDSPSCWQRVVQFALPPLGFTLPPVDGGSALPAAPPSPTLPA